ncbi:MAG: GWxTD domain-containing protein [Thermoanaerobaculia bacterium]
MKNLRTAVLFSLAALVATSGFSALSPENTAWGKSPVKWIMTKAETSAWAKIKSDDEAKAFIDLFWARRDPTPATPVNEAREGFDQRVRIADERYSAATAGSLTDQGRVFILLGAPTRIRTSGNQPRSKILTPSAMPSGRPDFNAAEAAQQGYSPKQIWVYERGKTALDLGAPVAEFGFIDQYGENQWKLELTGRTDYASLFERAANSYITQPTLKEAPKMQAQVPAAPAQPAGPGSFVTDAIRVAVDEVRAGKAEASKTLFLTYGEFITPEGEYFVPVSLYAPKGAGYAADGAYTFFGLVEKDGVPALIFEEAAKLAATKDDLYLDKSLKLEPGSYKAVFGLALAGKPVAIITTPLELKGMEKDAAGISNLLLSNNIYALAEAQAPTDPFAFGGMKVVPKSDRRFTNADELWYFFELRNPGMAEGATAPTVKVKTTITGKTTTGQNSKMSAPPTDVPAQELKGVPGHWVIGQSIPLTKFRAGDYTITLNVTDPVKNVSYDLQATFSVAATPAPAAAPATN